MAAQRQGADPPGVLRALRRLRCQLLRRLPAAQGIHQRPGRPGKRPGSAATSSIEVNDPLTYKGITFYQSSYGPAGEPLPLPRARPGDRPDPRRQWPAQGEHVPLPGGDSFAVTNYAESYDKFGPAVQMHVNTPDGQHGNPFIVLQNFPDFDAQRGGEQIFSPDRHRAELLHRPAGRQGSRRLGGLARLLPDGASAPAAPSSSPTGGCG